MSNVPVGVTSIDVWHVVGWWCPETISETLRELAREGQIKSIGTTENMRFTAVDLATGPR